jgi:hypothetical protein
MPLHPKTPPNLPPPTPNTSNTLGNTLSSALGNTLSSTLGNTLSSALGNNTTLGATSGSATTTTSPEALQQVERISRVSNIVYVRRCELADLRTEIARLEAIAAQKQSELEQATHLILKMSNIN